MKEKFERGIAVERKKAERSLALLKTRHQSELSTLSDDAARKLRDKDKEIKVIFLFVY